MPHTMTVMDMQSRKQTWPKPEKQQSFALQNLRGKGFTKGSRPFKATGHKGGISRQGSKRG